MTRNERFLLYKATDAQRITLLLVLIFRESLKAAALRAGKDQLYVHVRDMHTHFPTFVAMQMRRVGFWNVIVRDCFELCKLEGEECKGVTLFIYLDNPDPLDEYMGEMSYLHRLNETMLQSSIEEKLVAIPALANRVTYEELVQDATIILAKMGGHPTAT